MLARWTVASLSAISADAGTITAGTISAGVVIASVSFTSTGPTFTGDLYIGETGTNSGTVLIRGNFSGLTAMEGGFLETHGSTGNSNFQMHGASSALAFFANSQGGALATRQTVNGSLSDGTALQSLLDALSTSGYGLIVDNSSA